MPTYEYRCTRPNCGKDFEVVAKMSAPAPTQGEDCNRNDCCLEKKIGRVSAWVKGGSIAKESAKARVRDQEIIQAGGDRAPDSLTPKAQIESMHVCTKYCSHHTKAQ